MRLKSRLTWSSPLPLLVSSSSSPTSTSPATSFSQLCCLRYLNKKIFIAFIILCLTFAGCVWQFNVQQQQQQRHQAHQRKVGQASLLDKLELQQQNVFQRQRHENKIIDKYEQEKLLDIQKEQQRFDILKYEPHRDWHDYIAIANDVEHSPNDLGEFGKAAYLKFDDNDNESKIENSLKDFGYNLPLSNAISLERALPDFRPERCHDRVYHAYLPKVSIVIVYHNEQRSVLLRTLYSIINRTPAELLKEVLLIDDKSEPSILGSDFEESLLTKFANITKILHAPVRLGLIRARMYGARRAKGKVLVFLDAHVEATHNWLAPLLEPIYRHPKTCTTPLIDTIHYETFAYLPAAPSRGGFNWHFNYVQLPLRMDERLKLPEPHENPIMNGGLFAIAKKFLLELGGYDEGLEIWGAEQFELSFKIWLCGGKLLEVPCARLGHLYRSPLHQVKYTNRSDDFIAKNYKRVAEVWLDSFKESLYEHVPKLNNIDVGDISVQKALRKRLRCKPFDWFMHRVAPDLFEIYPPLEPTDFAKGAIQSMAAPELCLDSLNKPQREIVGFLRDCSPDLRHPYVSQRWSLSFRRDLRDTNGGCLEAQSWKRDAPIWLWPCHNQGGTQFWYYDRYTQMLVLGSGENETERRCLEADLLGRRVFVNTCDFVKPTMKWNFGYVNQTAMDQFFKHIPTFLVDGQKFMKLNRNKKAGLSVLFGGI